MGRTQRYKTLGALIVVVAACKSPHAAEKRPKDRKEDPVPPSAPGTTKNPSPGPTGGAAAPTSGASQGGVPTPAGSSFARDPGGETVYDRARNVTWLADANLPSRLPLGVKGINPSGSMDYKTALRWVAALNAYGNGAGYLGHKDWALPSTPQNDASCSSHNRYSFGFGCSQSMFAEVYAKALGLAHPSTAVAIPSTTVKGFTNFQPYLYWSESSNANHPENENGYTTFSFDNGFQGSNVSRNHMYAIPMLKGRVSNARVAEKTVYDPDADVTWLANANLAATETFGVADIAPSGSMSHATALKWVEAMNHADGGRGYLAQNAWRLPPTVASDPSCSAKDTFGFGCKGSPLGSLYSKLLGLRKGEPVVKAPNVDAGPFRGFEPYLYWSCHAAANSLACNSDPDLPSHLFAWSFSFGNGFQGTTMYSNELYVTVYHPGRHG